MSQYTIRPLDTESWDAYARLMDKHSPRQVIGLVIADHARSAGH